jgi:hypothetical protein
LKNPIFKVVALVLSALILVGCSTQNPGTAAYVGDKRITSGELDGYINELRDILPVETNDRGSTQIRTVLALMIIGEIIETAQRETDAQVDQNLIAGDYQALEQDVGGQEALYLFAANRDVPPSLIYKVLAQNRAIEAIGVALLPDDTAAVQNDEASAYILNLAENIEIKVNPRYGSWNSRDGSISPPANILSEPAYAVNLGLNP